MKITIKSFRKESIMNERILKKEESEQSLAKAEADMIVWMTFLQVMDKSDFVLVNDT
jgi:hypothetical protein